MAERTTERPVWVLLQRFDRSRNPDEAAEPGKVLGVYDDRAELDQRVERIAAANRQYPLRQRGPDAWVIGPDEDEGFFGNRPVLLFAVPATLTERVTVTRREEAPTDG